jgi:hypothetical protein
VTGFLWTALGLLCGFGMTAIGDMVSQEVRDRLDHLPQAILRLAALRLDPAQRGALYKEVWLPDLAYFLRGDEARPVTRLFQGTWYALGILVSARQSARELRLVPLPSAPHIWVREQDVELATDSYYLLIVKMAEAVEKCRRAESAMERHMSYSDDGHRMKDQQVFDMLRELHRRTLVARDDADKLFRSLWPGGNLHVARRRAVTLPAHPGCTGYRNRAPVDANCQIACGHWAVTAGPRRSR